jgi:hypothetical protein
VKPPNKTLKLFTETIINQSFRGREYTEKKATGSGSRHRVSGSEGNAAGNHAAAKIPRGRGESPRWIFALDRDYEHYNAKKTRARADRRGSLAVKMKRDARRTVRGNATG